MIVKCLSHYQGQGAFCTVRLKVHLGGHGLGHEKQDI